MAKLGFPLGTGICPLLLSSGIGHLPFQLPPVKLRLSLAKLGFPLGTGICPLSLGRTIGRFPFQNSAAFLGGCILSLFRRHRTSHLHPLPLVVQGLSTLYIAGRKQAFYSLCHIGRRPCYFLHRPSCAICAELGLPSAPRLLGQVVSLTLGLPWRAKAVQRGRLELWGLWGLRNSLRLPSVYVSLVGESCVRIRHTFPRILLQQSPLIGREGSQHVIVGGEYIAQFLCPVQVPTSAGFQYLLLEICV